MKAAKFELKFLKKEKEGKNIFSFYFDRVRVERGSGKRGSKEGFDFIPGQYLKLYLPIENPDDRGTSRYFTISSSPTDKNFITITTKIVKSSFKLKLKKLKPGEKIRIFGPIGYFDFDIKNKKNKLFLAGGMGITPYHSVLKYLNDKKLQIPITLIASFPTKKEIIFYDELMKIAAKNPHLKIVITLTNEQKIYPGFESGRIGEEMIKKYVQNFKESDIYIVGPQSFEFSMIEIVKKMGVKEKNLFTENFPGY